MFAVPGFWNRLTYQQVFHIETLFLADEQGETKRLKAALFAPQRRKSPFYQSNSLYSKELDKTNYCGYFAWLRPATDGFIPKIYHGLSTIYPQKEPES
jgi:hypothetical protein